MAFQVYDGHSLCLDTSLHTYASMAWGTCILTQKEIRLASHFHDRKPEEFSDVLGQTTPSTFDRSYSRCLSSYFAGVT